MDVPDAARRASAHVFVDDLDRPAVAEEDRHHLDRVLRLRAGEQVSVSDGRGGWRLCRYAPGPRGAGVSLEPAGDRRSVPAAEPEITIGFAPTKGDRPEWAVQKLTELGVDRIVPLLSSHSVVRWEGDRVGRHLARWRAVARQAAMQSRRVRLPVVEPPRSLAELLGEHPAGGVALAAPGGGPPDLRYPVLLVGPEGGWAPEEERDAPAVVSLGPGVMRTETAAVAGATLLGALRAGLVSPAG